MSKPYIYLAGPYSSDPVVNTGRAIDFGNWLMDEGYQVFVPHLSLFQHMRRPRTYDEWLAITIGWMKRCDVVVRLPGESSGSDAEVAQARAAGMPVYEMLSTTVPHKHYCLSFLEDVEDRMETRVES